MKEFKHNTKIGQRVTKIEINIRANADKHMSTCFNAEGVRIKNKEIVFQTEYKIALNDKWITILDRLEKGEKRDKWKSYLEDCSVSIKTNETYFANGVFGTIYTLGNVKRAMKKLTVEMQKQVDSKYGFLSNMNIASCVSKFELKEESK